MGSIVGEGLSFWRDSSRTALMDVSEVGESVMQANLNIHPFN